MFDAIFNLASHWFWFSVGVIFLLAEIAVPGTFFMLIFAIAALFTVVCTFFTDNVWLLLFCFGVFSLLGILLIKPVLQKMFKIQENVRPSTIDAMIGQKGTVTKAIVSMEKGSVKVGYEDWTAKSEDGSELPEGATVVVKKIEGVTLIVGGAE